MRDELGDRHIVPDDDSGKGLLRTESRQDLVDKTDLGWYTISESVEGISAEIPREGAVSGSLEPGRPGQPIMVEEDTVTIVSSVAGDRAAKNVNRVSFERMGR